MTISEETPERLEATMNWISSENYIIGSGTSERKTRACIKQLSLAVSESPDQFR
jgi:hypothetical protein